MKIETKTPPRGFQVGPAKDITLYDCAHIALETDEQVTFIGPAGSEYDVCRKSWGYYATPSLNSRLPGHGLHGALVRNAASGLVFLMLVEDGKEPEFLDYIASYDMHIIQWLDGRAPMPEGPPTP